MDNEEGDYNLINMRSWTGKGGAVSPKDCRLVERGVVSHDAVAHPHFPAAFGQCDKNTTASPPGGVRFSIGNWDVQGSVGCEGRRCASSSASSVESMSNVVGGHVLVRCRCSC